MKRKENKVCQFCGADSTIELNLAKKISVCNDCAKAIYKKLGNVLVPKGLPNMIVRVLNKSTIKPLKDMDT